MFFTRDFKHRIQQDTYIQRARMFGSRKAHLIHFELSIPEHLYVDWHRCFVFHRLALEAIKAGLGSPVWLGDSRIATVASSSIDEANVSMDKGEMSFPIFDYSEDLENLIAATEGPISKLRSLQNRLGNQALPDYLIRFIEHTSPLGSKSIAIHGSETIANYKDGDDINKDKIQRRRGFIGTNQLQKNKYPDAVHHIMIFYNAHKRARVFYKFDGSIKFIKNLKNV